MNIITPIFVYFSFSERVNLTGLWAGIPLVFTHFTKLFIDGTPVLLRYLNSRSTSELLDYGNASFTRLTRLRDPESVIS